MAQDRYDTWESLGVEPGTPIDGQGRPLSQGRYDTWESLGLEPGTPIDGQGQPLSSTVQAFEGEEQRFDTTAPPPEHEPATFGESLGRGVDIAQKFSYDFADWVGEVTGAGRLEEWAEAGSARQDEEIAAAGPRKQFFEEESWVPAAKSFGELNQFLKDTVGEMTPLLAPSIAGFATGAAIGSVVPGIGTTIGGLIGAFTPAFVMGVGEVQGQLREEGVEAPMAAFIGGSGIAALDTVLPGKIGGRLVRAFGRETAEEITKKLLGKPVKSGLLARMGREAAGGLRTEAITEALQEAVGEVATAKGVGRDVDWAGLPKIMAESGIAGGVMGVLAGGASGVATDAGPRAKPPPPAAEPSPEPTLAEQPAPAAPPAEVVSPEAAEAPTEAKEKQEVAAFEAALKKEKAEPTPEEKLAPVSREALQAEHEQKKAAARVKKEPMAAKVVPKAAAITEGRIAPSEPRIKVAPASEAAKEVIPAEERASLQAAHEAKKVAVKPREPEAAPVAVSLDAIKKAKDAAFKASWPPPSAKARQVLVRHHQTLTEQRTGADTFFRVHDLYDPVSDLMREDRASRVWTAAVEEGDFAPRIGVSVFASEEEVLNFIKEREATVTSSILVEVEGLPTQEEDDFDVASGAILIKPDRVVSVRDFTDAERDRIGGEEWRYWKARQHLEAKAETPAATAVPTPPVVAKPKPKPATSTRGRVYKGYEIGRQEYGGHPWFVVREGRPVDSVTAIFLASGKPIEYEVGKGQTQRATGGARFFTSKSAAIAAIDTAEAEAAKRTAVQPSKKPPKPPTVKLADVTEVERAQLRSLLERDEKPPTTYGQTRKQYRAAISKFLEGGKPSLGSNVAVQVVRQTPTQDFAADLAEQKQTEPLEEREPPTPVIPFRRGDVENMLQREWNKVRGLYDDAGDPKTWREWVKALDSESIAVVLENDSELYDIYLRQLPEEVTATDVVEAYKAGTLELGRTRRGVTPAVTIEDIPVESTGAIGEPVATPILSTQALKSAWRAALTRVTERTRASVLAARKRILLQAHVAPIWEGLGVNRSAISTRLRSWANYSVQATELQRSVNRDKPLVSHWTGIENLSSLSQATVNPADVEAFVKKIDATNNWYDTDDPKTVSRAQELRQYITRVFLGFDTRIDFSDLSFDIHEHMAPRGRYNSSGTLITLRAGGANTMAHEFGHYLDNKWLREAGGAHDDYASERTLLLAQVEERTSPERAQWMERFSEFVLDIGMRSDIGSDYTQRRAEVFARFSDQFIRWAERTAGVPSYGESFYDDQFTRGDFLRFVDLLQEKTFVDAKDGNPFGSRQQARPRPAGVSEALYEEAHQQVPVFYSKLRRVVETTMPRRAAASQVQAIVRKGGVKKDEIAWTGINEWLADQDTVTKAAVLDYLEKHGLELQETELGTTPISPPSPDVQLRFMQFEGEPKFAEYTTPGGKDYREFLIRLPAAGTDEELAQRWFSKPFTELEPSERDFVIREAKTEPPAGEFRAGHFDEPNVVAHIRFKTFTGPNGEKVMVIEEVQSDWHQQGRKYGYNVKDDPQRLLDIEAKRRRVAELKDKLADAEQDHRDVEAARLGARAAVYKELGITDLPIPHPPDFMVKLRERAMPFIEKLELAERKERNTRAQLGLARQELQNLEAGTGTTEGVPDAPFKTSWAELAMKRMLRYAADQGFDTIAWTTGQQQADRYDLSKRIESVVWTGETEQLRAYDHSGTEVIHENGVGSEDLDTYLGADLAARLRESPTERPSGHVREFGRDVYELTGQDLRVGGEGMKQFYDRMLPSMMKKFGKKWGAAVRDISLAIPRGTLTPMHSMSITPEMRDSLLYTGQPLFEKERVTLAQLRGIATRLGTSVETQADRARKQGYDVPTLRPAPRPRQGIVPDADLPAAKAIAKKRALAYPSLQKHDESIRDDIADIMAEAEGFQKQRRDVQSIERTKALAAAMELPTGPLRAGTAGTAEELYAYANGIEYTLGKYNEIQAKGAQQTHEDVLEASRLWDQAIMLTLSYRGMKAETGRAMNILRSKHVLRESKEVRFIQEAINLPGFDKDLSRIRQSLARAGDDPVKLLQELKDHSATWFDYFQAYAYQNMLSGPKTHLRNTFGNSGNIGFNLSLVPLAAAPLEVYFAKKQGRAMEVYQEEAAIGVAAAYGAKLEGWRRAAFSFTHGYRQDQIDEALEGNFDFKRVELMPEITIKGKRYGIPPGRVYDWTKMAMNYSSRGLVAGDEFFRTMAREAEKQTGMYAEVRKQGITDPAEIAQRSAEIWTSVKGPDFEIKKLVLWRAEQFAARMVFQEKPGTFVSGILDMKNAPDWRVRWTGMAIAPFVRTPGAILRQGFEWSPIGFTMKEARKGTARDPEGDQRQGAQARGRAAIGSLMSFPLAMLAASGYLTGSPPDDPEEREEFYAQGKLPNAVFIPLSSEGLEGEGIWIRYVLFQPFSIAASAWASALQGLSIKAAAGEDINEEDIEGSILMGIAGAAASLLDQSFLSTVDTILSTLQSPERGWTRLLSNMLSPYVPNSALLRTIVQGTDPYFRRPKGLRQSLKALNPWQSRQLIPLITRHGEPAERTPDNFFWRSFMVPMVSRARTDKLTTELARLGLRRTRSRGGFKAGGVSFAKNDDQKALIGMAVGYTRKVLLEAIVSRSFYDNWSDEKKFETLQAAYPEASRRVRQRVVNRERMRKDWTLQNLMDRREYREIEDPTLGVRAWPQER